MLRKMIYNTTTQYNIPIIIKKTPFIVRYLYLFNIKQLKQL